MNRKNKKLLIYKESEILELKASFGEWKEIIITLSAFANKKGGIVIVGLDDKANPLHMHVGSKTIEDFVNKIKNHTDPVLYPSINVKTFGLGEIVEITVAQSDYKPIFAFEKAWIRIGKSNIKLSANELRELIRRYSYQEFDSQISKSKTTASEFDSYIYKKFSSLGYNFPKDLSIAEYLSFTKINTDYPQAIVKAACFKGNKPVTFLDARNFDKSLILITDQVLEFIKKNIRLQYIITGKAERDERWEYPMVALREAILNALVHRDYNDSGNIQIRIFDDFIEIWSPGLLPKELNINSLIKNSRSIPRNKTLLKLFHLVGEIENWGTGFARISDACAENGNPAPIFEERSGAFVIHIKRILDKSSGKSSDKSSDKSSGKSSDKVFNLIEDKPDITINRISEIMGLSSRAIEKIISKLKSDNRIKRIGGRKTGQWETIT